jgi:cob(I)alamin adenosyltransferase
VGVRRPGRVGGEERARLVSGAGRWPRTNVVITGRDAPPELVALADTVTEMTVVKHAYQQGVPARKGIEY